MTDITERLRAWATPGETITGNVQLYLDAADEIERLRGLAQGPSREAMDALLAFRHGDTKHLTQEHARVLYAALAPGNGAVEAVTCECGFSQEVCSTNPCYRKKVHLAGLTPESEWPKGAPIASPSGCSCHPDDNPPRPCPQKHAYSECVAAAAALDPVTVEWMRQSEAAFEFIRLRLINNLDEPGRSAFWKAVETRDRLRALIGHPASKGEPVRCQRCGSGDAMILCEGCWSPLSSTDSASSSVDFHQLRGRSHDIIREALATYDEWMLDDDYEAKPKLHEIMKRMRERIDGPVAQTEPAQPFTQCSECWQPATCKKYGCRVPSNDGAEK